MGNFRSGICDTNLLFKSRTLPSWPLTNFRFRKIMCQFGNAQFNDPATGFNGTFICNVYDRIIDSLQLNVTVISKLFDIDHFAVIFNVFHLRMSDDSFNSQKTFSLTKFLIF